MFGKEKYSRESYEETEKAVEINNANYKSAGTPVPSMNYNPNYKGMLANIREAEKRLEGLKARGYVEARDLNERYDALKKQAAEAAQALFEFERDKLGMHEQKQKKSG
jgi:hypothetical protein